MGKGGSEEVDKLSFTRHDELKEVRELFTDGPK